MFRRLLCTASVQQSGTHIVLRTPVHSPREQLITSSVLGKFTTYPEKQFKKYFEPVLKPEFIQQLKVFNDYSLLIRKPALDIVKDIVNSRQLQLDSSGDAQQQDQKSDTAPLLKYVVPRFIVYGQPGCGISVILSQVVYFAGLEDWLIFPFTDAENWLNRCPDVTPCNEYHQRQAKSFTDKDAFDFPNRSATWLQQFLRINNGLLDKIIKNQLSCYHFFPKNEFVLSRDVEWTKADVARTGTPWKEIIDFALTRTKYSTDCIGILLREMRTLCSKPGSTPCLLLIDGVNFLWCRGTRLVDRTLQTRISVDRLAIVHHLRRAVQGDWRNGAIVSSLNVRGAWPTDRDQYTPGYLLGKSGFESMDPFIPVPVENYSREELAACLNFYEENRWLTNPDALTDWGRLQLTFLSDSNPLELDRLAAEW